MLVLANVGDSHQNDRFRSAAATVIDRGGVPVVRSS